MKAKNLKRLISMVLIMALFIQGFVFENSFAYSRKSSEEMNNLVSALSYPEERENPEIKINKRELDLDYQVGETVRELFLTDKSGRKLDNVNWYCQNGSDFYYATETENRNDLYIKITEKGTVTSVKENGSNFVWAEYNGYLYRCLVKVNGLGDAKKNVAYAKADEIIKEKGFLNIESDIDKALAVHDYLVNTITYDMKYQANDRLYGSLVLGRGVCYGYAQSFTAMMKRLNVATETMTGYVRNSDTSQEFTKHAWNKVNIDGKWYIVDATGDDAGDYGIKHKLFFAGLDIFNHMYKEYGSIENLDESDTYKYYAYKKAGIFAADEQELDAVIKKQYNATNASSLKIRAALPDNIGMGGMKNAVRNIVGSQPIVEIDMYDVLKLGGDYRLVGIKVDNASVAKTESANLIAVTTDGSASRSASKIILEFNREIPDLTVENITVEGVEKGSLKHISGGKYELEISSLESTGNVNAKVTVDKRGYNITDNVKDVVVQIVRAEEPKVTYEAVDGSAIWLDNVEKGMEYALGEGVWYPVTTNGRIQINVTTEKFIMIRRIGDKANGILNSDVQVIKIESRNSPYGLSSEDCTDKNNPNGVIKNLSPTMEYKKAGTSQWIPCTGGELTGLYAGMYFFRYKADGKVLASGSTFVEVKGEKEPVSNTNASETEKQTIAKENAKKLNQILNDTDAAEVATSLINSGSVLANKRIESLLPMTANGVAYSVLKQASEVNKLIIRFSDDSTVECVLKKQTNNNSQNMPQYTVTVKGENNIYGLFFAPYDSDTVSEIEIAIAPIVEELKSIDYNTNTFITTQLTGKNSSGLPDSGYGDKESAYYGEYFKAVQNDLDKILFGITEYKLRLNKEANKGNEDQILANEQLLALSGYDNEKERFLLALSYLYRLYNLDFNGVNVKDILLYHPDFYTSLNETNALGTEIKKTIRQNINDPLNWLCNSSQNYSLGNLTNSISTSSPSISIASNVPTFTNCFTNKIVTSASLIEFLERNNKLFNNNADMNQWFVNNTKAIVIEKASLVNTTAKYKVYDKLSSDEKWTNHILPILAVSEGSIYIISNPATISYGLIETYIDPSIEKTAAEYKTEKNKLIVELNKIAEDQANFVDFLFRVSDESQNNNITSSCMVLDSMRRNVTGDARTQWSAETGSNAALGVKEFFKPLSLYSNYSDMGGEDSGGAVGTGLRKITFKKSRMLLEEGISVYTHELTHQLVGKVLLNDYGTRDGLTAELYPRGLFEVYESATKEPIFNLNTAKQTPENDFVNTSSNRFGNAEDIQTYMQGLMDVIYTLEYAEAEVILNSPKLLNIDWFKKVTQTQDTSRTARTCDNFQLLTSSEADSITDINYLVDNNIVAKRYKFRGYTGEGVADNNGYYVVPLFTADYSASVNANGGAGDVSIRRNAYELLAEFGYYEGLVPYISNQYKNQVDRLTDENIINKIFADNGTSYTSFAEFKKAMYKRRIDKINELSKISFQWEGQTYSNVDFAKIKELMETAMLEDLKKEKEATQAYLVPLPYDTKLEKLKGEIFKAYKDLSSEFETSIYQNTATPVITSQTLTFANSNISKVYGDKLTVSASNSVNDGGKITYSSETPEVATVNVDTGEVILIGVGRAVIKAKAAAVVGKYSEGTATCTVNVEAKTLDETDFEVISGAIFKEYDATRNADGVKLGVKASSLVNAQDVITVEGTALYDTVEAGTNKNVVFTIEKFDGNGKYTIANNLQVTTNGDIVKTDYKGSKNLDLQGKYGETVDEDLAKYMAEGSKLSTVTTSGNTDIFQAAPVVKGNRVEFALKNEAANVGKQANILIVVNGSTNYKDYNIEITVNVINKKIQSNFGFATNLVNKVYGENSFVVEAKGQAEGCKVEYYSESPTIAQVDKVSGEVIIKKAGAVIIKAVASENADYAEKTVSYTLNVQKADLKIKGKVFEIEVGDTLPNIENPVEDKHFTVEGLKGTDKLEAVPVMEYWQDGQKVDLTDSNKAGIYEIKISGNVADEEKYMVEFISGKLVINEKSAPEPEKPEPEKPEPEPEPEKPEPEPEKPEPAPEPEKPEPEPEKPEPEKPEPEKPEPEPEKPAPEPEKPEPEPEKPEPEKPEPEPGKPEPEPEKPAPTPTPTPGGNSGGSNAGENTAPDSNTGGTSTDIIAGSEAVITIDELTGNKITTNVQDDGTVIKIVEDKHGAIQIEVEKYEGNLNPVKLEVAADGLSPNSVLYEINQNGTKTVIKKSVIIDGVLKFEISNNSKLMIDNRNTSFADIDSDHWSKTYIDFVANREIFKGVKENVFAPNNTMSRAMLMTVLARIEGVNTEGGSSWYENGMNWAKQNAISDGTNPNKEITREELVTMIYRYMGNPSVTSKKQEIVDGDLISDYARNPFLWAIEVGIIQGNPNGTVNPKGQATRAEVAAIIQRLLEYYFK